MTKIEWAHAGLGRGKTWNPIRARDRRTGARGWHCEKVSPACANCYAERWNQRPGIGGTGLAYRPGHRADVEHYLDEQTLLAPLRWKQPTGIFVCSMTDIFGDWVETEWLDKIFAIAALCPQHILIYLTKRSARMRAYMSDPRTPHRIARAIVDMWIAKQVAPDDNWPVESIGDIDMPDDIKLRKWPLPNVWPGVTAEDQPRANERIPDLLATPAAIRFVSCEPLRGHINLRRIRIAPDYHT
ncbi:DUF5131 family protein, partial [Methylosinus sp. R-45379]|uniref:DUF5131 family protein n=1 Tax=Methylosinus sp. R-45379 TaxID=980563 RepID=UPI000AB1279B